ncbi:MAG: ROK family protein [Clostridiaceae bacterium]|nr:ROK family protein [Clostridiaceae bacterium]
MKQYVIGIDVGGTKIAYGLFDVHRKLVDKHKTLSNATLSAEEFFYKIINDIYELLGTNNLTLEDIKGIGIGMPSYVLFEEGKILMTSNLTNIANFPAKAYLMKKLGENVKIIIDNDGHTGALAEHRHGAGRGFHHILYCPVSTGISSGIIINDELFRGSYGWSGESGHMIVNPDEGIMCGCKNKGCLMSYCSGSMIVKHILNKIELGEQTIMVELAGGKENISAEHILKAHIMKDDMAIWAVEQMAKYIGIWCYNLYSTLNINCFIFGGGLVKFGEMLFEPVRKVFNSYNHNEFPVYFKFAELGDDFGIIGAIELLF